MYFVDALYVRVFKSGIDFYGTIDFAPTIDAEAVIDTVGCTLPCLCGLYRGERREGEAERSWHPVRHVFLVRQSADGRSMCLMVVPRGWVSTTTC